MGVRRGPRLLRKFEERGLRPVFSVYKALESAVSRRIASALERCWPGALSIGKQSCVGTCAYDALAMVHGTFSERNQLSLQNRL